MPQGYYDVTIYDGNASLNDSEAPRVAHRTYPFGRFSEIGFWLDEAGFPDGYRIVIETVTVEAPRIPERCAAHDRLHDCPAEAR